MNMYGEKRGRKISKKLLKKRLMNFFLYSHTQKHNTQTKKVEISQKKNIANNVYNDKYNKNIRQNLKSISGKKEVLKNNILINNTKLERNNINNASIIMKNQNNFYKINDTESLNFLSYSKNVTNFYLKDVRFIRNEVINKNIKFDALNKLVRNKTHRRYSEDK